MSNDFPIPRFGPGSQSEPDGAALDYLEMPADMRTYAPHVPMIEATDTVAPAMALMAEIAEAARRSAAGAPPAIFDLLPLDTQNRRLIAETMGEGEVAMKLRGLPALSVQESVFAGIWGVTGAGIDRIEIGHVPEAAHIRAFVPTVARRDLPLRDGVVNAPALLAELEGKSEGFSGNLHVINLSLLPHTEEDLVWLDQRLGHGSTDILSRGYGNCRVRATTLPFVWRVQFFNAMDTLILDTFEVTAMPEVALAAAEDLAESGARLLDVLEAMR
ncbi:hydrogenase expression/formation protein [Ovoidimarina sediminis]|uniref:hydrogenase expression/formation protein n=1 Tax=Ovoidimarina sediminis TaxID=3079856 RepID=UPI0029094801|nr:hydrogenase expression/formation C-terminal domain-containing protein [Rhodophyticola sp. MJ-SS7]MDU8945447.1 hydrogenase expression/formation C-terminal domain-containing protein [Rhodophyticola sp. MJ-SS7]